MTAVFFNLDGTLTRNDVDFEAVYSNTVQQAELDALEDAYDTYTDNFFDYFSKGWAFPRRQAMLDVLTEHDMDDLGDTDRFADAWEDNEAAATALQDGATGVLENLSDAYTLGVLTNGTGRLQRMKLEQHDIAQLFDSIVISGEIGETKPNAAFFDAARDAIDADTYIIVSHDLRRDILPAKRADYLTVWVSTADNSNEQLDAVIDKQVASLNDVPAAIDELAN